MLKINTEALSSLGFNIATGIILEKLIENKNKKLPIFFNVKTLFRNYIGCLNGNADDKIKALKNHVNARPVINNFIEDTKLLISSCLESGYDINIYNINYDPFLKKVIEPRDLNNLKGLRAAMHKIEKFVLSEVKKNFPGILKEFNDPKIKKDFPKEFYIVTHIGIELLNFTENKNVTLLESHTGEQKDYTRWYSKYAKIGSKRMDIFPFNELLYNILGDNEYVKPANIKLRRHIFNIAIEDSWTSDYRFKEVTTSLKRADKILLDSLLKQYSKYF